MLCKNSERKVMNMERVSKVAVSALKQSQQAWLPGINEMAPFSKIINSTADQKFIAHVDSANPTHLHSITQRNKKYLVLIGPEGDFSIRELELAAKNNFEVVSLGESRLDYSDSRLLLIGLFCGLHDCGGLGGHFRSGNGFNILLHFRNLRRSEREGRGTGGRDQSGQ